MEGTGRWADCHGRPTGDRVAGWSVRPFPTTLSSSASGDVPFALLVMITGVTLIYTLVQIVGLSVLPDLGESETPLAEAAGILLGPFGAWLLTIGAALSILGTTNNTVLAGSRYLYALAASGRLPAVFAGVHPASRPRGSHWASSGRHIDNQTPSTTRCRSEASMGYHARTYPEVDQGSVNWQVSQSG